jgi:hypothetical protein
LDATCRDAEHRHEQRALCVVQALRSVCLPDRIKIGEGAGRQQLQLLEQRVHQLRFGSAVVQDLVEYVRVVRAGHSVGSTGWKQASDEALQVAACLRAQPMV